MREICKRRPLLAYFASTFAISWGAIVGAFGVGPISSDELATMGPLLYVALLLGPSVAGLSMVGVVSGREGFVELGARLRTWRVGFRWYALAACLAPVSLALVLLGLSLVPGLIPDVFTREDLGTRVVGGIVAGCVVAFCEELGWTGFAIPHLRARHGVVASGVILGVLWGLWHFPPFWEHDSFVEPLAFGLLVTRLFSWLPPFRILMVWLFERTQSLLLPILMHTSLVATQFVLIVPFELTPTAALASTLTWAAVLWLIAVIALRTKG